MNYCALDDAFPSMAAPSPGCAANDAAKMARKEERRRARRCKGPAATYLALDGSSTDPDRPSEEPSVVQAMNETTGMSEHAPVTAQYDGFTSRHHDKPADQKRPNFDDDPLYNYLKSEAANHIMPVETPRAETLSNELPPLKNFFGADPDGDSFADYIPDASDYRLQPDFQKAFGQAGAARAGSTPTVPAPPVDMYWKPLTRSGAQSSFVEHLPPPTGKYHGSNKKQDDSMEEVRKKLDKLFARLDDMNASSPEQVTSEILMFISSGIFVLFFMDLLVKKASTMRF
jgi:hypothetical protein